MTCYWVSTKLSDRSVDDCWVCILLAVLFAELAVNDVKTIVVVGMVASGCKLLYCKLVFISFAPILFSPALKRANNKLKATEKCSI